MNSFFNSIVNRVRSYKEEDLREFVDRKARVDDVVVGYYLDNQDKFNLSDSLKVGDKELEKIADELSKKFNSVFKLDTKDSDKVLSALLERREVDLKLSDDVDLKITRRLKNGFTLIELMITVAIVGVLGSVAIPSYQDYVARSQISEAIVLASGAKPLVAEYYANYGEYPNSSDVGFSGNTGKYVESIEIQNGNIIAKLNNNVNEKIRGKLIILNPKGDGSDIIISSNSIFDKLLGISSAIANNQNGWNCFANVEQKYLPKTCETREFPNENGSGENENTTPYNLDDGKYKFDQYKFSDNGKVMLLGGNFRFLLSEDGDIKTFIVDKDDPNLIGYPEDFSDRKYFVDSKTGLVADYIPSNMDNSIGFFGVNNEGYYVYFNEDNTYEIKTSGSTIDDRKLTDTEKELVRKAGYQVK
ncbi:pilin [Achromobacter xylosoxidans]